MFANLLESIAPVKKEVETVPKGDEVSFWSGLSEFVAPIEDLKEVQALPSTPSANCEQISTKGFQSPRTPSENGTLHEMGRHLLTPSPRKLSKGLSAASSSSTAALNNPLQGLVLEACNGTAHQNPKEISTVISLCATMPGKFNEKSARRLRKAFKPEYAHARTTGDAINFNRVGMTPLLVAVVSDNVQAAKILLEIAGKEQLKAVDITGKSAWHLAAEYGHSEMLEWLREVDDDRLDQLDLAGKTPLGSVLTSPQPKAIRGQKELYGMLFSPENVSMFGSPEPVQVRTSTMSQTGITYGSSHMPGRRVKNEDVMMAQPLPNDWLFLGVMDGHSDQGKIAALVGNEFPDHVDLSANDLKEACTKACLAVDEKILKSKLAGGSTACLALLSSTQIVVANVGDCRCLLIQRNGLTEDMEELSLEENDMDKSKKEYSVVPLSEDHTAELPRERERIERAGLTVSEISHEENGQEEIIYRVVLSEVESMAPSRSFGDFDYKNKDDWANGAVVALPDVVIHERQNTDAYLVMACDGIWDVMSNADVADLVMSASAADLPLAQIGDMITNECFERGSRDNLSALVVGLAQTTTTKKLFSSP